MICLGTKKNVGKDEKKSTNSLYKTQPVADVVLLFIAKLDQSIRCDWSDMFVRFDTLRHLFAHTWDTQVTQIDYERTNTFETTKQIFSKLIFRPKNIYRTPFHPGSAGSKPEYLPKASHVARWHRGDGAPGLEDTDSLTFKCINWKNVWPNLWPKKSWPYMHMIWYYFGGQKGSIIRIFLYY